MFYVILSFFYEMEIIPGSGPGEELAFVRQDDLEFCWKHNPVWEWIWPCPGDTAVLEINLWTTGTSESRVIIWILKIVKL